MSAFWRRFWLESSLLVIITVGCVFLSIAILRQLLGPELQNLGIVSIFLVFGVAERLLHLRDRREELAEYERRLEPVRQLLNMCCLMPEKNEREYRHRLLQQIFQSLDVVAKPEAPLPSGTHVDAYMRFDDEDWYITIKRGLDNQKRLIIQGEIEDIILHAPRRGGRLWIYAVVGVSDKLDPNEMWHFAKLSDYAACRSAQSADQQVKGFLNIEVMQVRVPSR